MPDRPPRAPKEPPGPTQALEIAARFLGTRPRTRWEVARRLARAGANAEVTETTLERLAQLGLVDDADFARWWHGQRDRHSPRGRRMLEAELRAKGVPREIIELLREAEPERGPDDAALPTTEDERAAVALEAHLRGRPLPTDPKALQRVGMFLMRRGFDPGIARSTIRARVAADGEVDELPDAEDQVAPDG
jgi:regulatory protein